MDNLQLFKSLEQSPTSLEDQIKQVSVEMAARFACGDANMEETSIRQRIDNMYKQLVKDGGFPRFDNPETKSNAESTTLRKEGNELYVKKEDDQKVLKLYTQSVAKATEESEELALAYGNRSAILFRTRKYVPCLLDINRALKGNYPDHLKVKLLIRKKDCMEKIREEDQMKRILQRHKDQLKKLLNSSLLRMMFNEAYPSLCDLLRPCELTGEETEPKPYLSLERPKFNNPLLPDTSRKIKINYDAKYGRHFVATEKIEPGELISVQKFYAKILSVNYVTTNCSYCFVRCDALIPCKTCALVMYCSEQCRKDAYDLYHRTECKILAFCKRRMWDDSPNMVALQSFLIGTEQGAKLKNLMKDPKFENLFTEQLKKISAEIGVNVRKVKFETHFADSPTYVSQKYSSDYLAICNIQNNVMKLSCGRSNIPCFIALCLKTVNILKQTGFFANIDVEVYQDLDSLSEVEMFAALLLFNHFGCMYNSTQIHESVPTLENCTCKQVADIGKGICPLFSLFNHSCNPNVYRVAKGHDTAAYAIRPIMPNEQIFVSYTIGCTYGDSDRSERAVVGDMYGFKCTCEPCRYDWPKMYELITRKDTLLTTDTKVKSNIKKIHTKLANMCCSDWERTEVIFQYCKTLHRYVKNPSFMTLFCQQALVHEILFGGNFSVEYPLYLFQEDTYHKQLYETFKRRS